MTIEENVRMLAATRHKPNLGLAMELCKGQGLSVYETATGSRWRGYRAYPFDAEFERLLGMWSSDAEWAEWCVREAAWRERHRRRRRLAEGARKYVYTCNEHEGHYCGILGRERRKRQIAKGTWLMRGKRGTGDGAE